MVYGGRDHRFSGECIAHILVAVETLSVVIVHGYPLVMSTEPQILSGVGEHCLDFKVRHIDRKIFFSLSRDIAFHCIVIEHSIPRALYQHPVGIGVYEFYVRIRQHRMAGNRGRKGDEPSRMCVEYLKHGPREP